MPFRAELKRPDLKGQFPCSVCGKIFCHSSSLSRHRMQAHFKSYTCTMCNQEISSNETLRSHMFRQHQISRMFMCRCCNWAFPDKTSLHIHMQSMVRNGDPGDVHILAKSQTVGEGIGLIANAKMEDLEAMAMSDGDQSPDFGAGGDDSPAPSMTTPGGIFPTAPTKHELLSRFKNKNSSTPSHQSPSVGTNGQQSSSAAAMAAAAAASSLLAGAAGGATSIDQQAMLASWLANNFPTFNNPLAQLAALQRHQQLGTADATASPATQQRQNVAVNLGLNHNGETSLNMVKNEEEDDDLVVDNLEETMEEDGDGQLKIDEAQSPSLDLKPNGETKDSDLQNVNRSAISANPLNSLMYRKKLNNALRSKRKSGKCEQVTNFFYNNNNNNLEPSKETAVEEMRTEAADPSQHHQHSPTALSDSQTSSSGVGVSETSSSTSPAKCFECQVLKGKLSMAENQNRFLESKASSLENKIGRMENHVSSLESTSKRYEAEHKLLRQQCEVLERKLLACQEKSLKYLENGMNHTENNMKKLLEDLLETTSLLHGQH